MRNTWAGLVGLIMVSGVFLGAVGCSIDSSGDSNEELDAFFDSSSAELAGETEGLANQPSSGSSSSSQSSGSSSGSSSGGGGGTGGFIWKPVSESDGNLVVLLPGEFRGRVAGAAIYKGGTLVEQGRFSGDTHNGNRPHYRFSQPGAGYGTGLTLRARLTDGSTRTWGIPNGGSRVG